MITKTNNSQYQQFTSDLKHQAAGQWPTILHSLGNIPTEILDGKHHECPCCGGTDRFRMLDERSGALYCNQCFNRKNGDGIAALQWLNGWSFQEATRELYAHLNGYDPSIGKRTQKVEITAKKEPERELGHKYWQGISSAQFKLLGDVDRQYHADKLGVSRDSLERLGAGMYGEGLAFPMRLASGEMCGIRTRCTITKEKRAVKGSKNGLFIPANLDRSKTLYVCEGPTNTAALLTLGVNAIGRAGATTNLDDCCEFVSTNQIESVIVVADNDSHGVGLEWAEKLAEKLNSIAKVQILLPKQNDIRDEIRDGITANDLGGFLIGSKSTKTKKCGCKSSQCKHLDADVRIHPYNRDKRGEDGHTPLIDESDYRHDDPHAEKICNGRFFRPIINYADTDCRKYAFTATRGDSERKAMQLSCGRHDCELCRAKFIHDRFYWFLDILQQFGSVYRIEADCSKSRETITKSIRRKRGHFVSIPTDKCWVIYSSVEIAGSELVEDYGDELYGLIENLPYKAKIGCSRGLGFQPKQFEEENTGEKWKKDEKQYPIYRATRRTILEVCQEFKVEVSFKNSDSAGITSFKFQADDETTDEIYYEISRRSEPNYQDSEPDTLAEDAERMNGLPCPV